MPSTETEINVTVKLFSTLRQYAPKGEDARGFLAALPNGATVGDLTQQLGLPDAKWKVAFRNNVQCRDPATPLEDDDLVAFFPPIAGG